MVSRKLFTKISAEKTSQVSSLHTTSKYRAMLKELHNYAIRNTHPVVGENGSLHQADINKELPIINLVSSVDVARAIGELEFAEDLPGVFEQVHRSLKDNGVFVFTSKLLDGYSPESQTHYPELDITNYHHSTEELKSPLEKSGFSLENILCYT